MVPLIDSRGSLFLALLLHLVALCFATLPAVTHADGAAAVLKAGFITKFPRFITWPAISEKVEQQPFSFCVLGKASITPHLVSLLQLKEPGTRPIVRTFQVATEASHCNLLFVPKARARILAKILHHLGDLPVLIVSDVADAVQIGAHIGLYQSGGRIGFEINRKSFSHSGLQVSFRLLEMARAVE